MGNEFNILLVGDAQAGKTALFHRLKEYPIDTNYQPTTFHEYGTRLFSVENETRLKEDVRLLITVMPGKRKYQIFKEQRYNETAAVLICVDLSQKNAVENIIKYVRPIPVYIPFFIVLTKIDLSQVKTELAKFTIMPYIQPNLMGIFSTSALTGENVSALFETVATALFDLQISAKRGSSHITCSSHTASHSILEPLPLHEPECHTAMAFTHENDLHNLMQELRAKIYKLDGLTDCFGSKKVKVKVEDHVYRLYPGAVEMLEQLNLPQPPAVVLRSCVNIASHHLDKKHFLFFKPFNKNEAEFLRWVSNLDIQNEKLNLNYPSNS